MDVINEFIALAAASPWLPLVMFAVAIIDGFFPPVPSETVLVTGAAAAAAAGDIPTVIVLGVAAAAGAVIGDNIAYAIGRKIGVSRFRWMRGPKVTAALARAQNSLARRGAPLILGARYIPVGRVAVKMSAGALRYPWRRRFLPLSVLAAVTWAGYGAAIGVIAGRFFKDQPLLSAILGVAFAVVAGVVIDRIVEGRRRRAEGRNHATALSSAETDAHSAQLATQSHPS